MKKINMKKTTLLIIILILLTGCTNSQVKTQNQTNSITPTQENLLQILKTNKDGKDYLNNYPNTEVINLTKINPNEFKTLKINSQYKELYTDLPKKELYKVNFNGGSQLSIITIIDIEEKKVLKIFGSYMIGLNN